MGWSIRVRRTDSLEVTVTGLDPDEYGLLHGRCLYDPACRDLDLGFTGPSAFRVNGSPARIRRFCSFLKAVEQFPPQVPSQIESCLSNDLRPGAVLTLNGSDLDLGSRSHIMGVLNVTPDSFSDGGRFNDAGSAVRHVREMAAAGADIIDIGGESTRPGSTQLHENDELRRIIPVIEQVTRENSVPVSVDTYKATVARAALKAGASMVNDISGLRFSADMAMVVADHGAAVVIMHIKGTPQNMQKDPVYTDVIGEIRDWLEDGIAIALKAGIDRNRILIDPGIGFGKTLEHNLIILNRLSEFRALGCPIVLGTSRKRFIGTVLDIPVPELRIEGTAATVALGIQQGAHILRVHDVAYMTRVARMTDAILRQAPVHQAPNHK